MKKIIAVFCGTFNPPLNSHFLLAEQVIRENENIEKLIFVPVGNNYNKKGLIDEKHRYNMLKIVCDNNSKFEVSDIELEQEEQPYTVETLEKIQAIYPLKEIRLIMGTDNLKNLEKWYKAERLVKKYKIILLGRDEDNVERIMEENEFLKNNKDAFILLKHDIRIDLSSSFIRERIQKEESIEDFLPKGVLEYIEKNKLYREKG